MNKPFLIILVALMIVMTVSAQEIDVSKIHPLKEIENPYSRALGGKIAGSVLVGFGAVGACIGIIFDATDYYENMYEDLDMKDLGTIIEKAIWIECSMELAIGVPLLIVSSIKNSRWEKWDKENRIDISFNAKGLVVKF
jgi:hypothetical protein